MPGPHPTLKEFDKYKKSADRMAWFATFFQLTRRCGAKNKATNS